MYIYVVYVGTRAGGVYFLHFSGGSTLRFEKNITIKNSQDQKNKNFYFKINV